MTKKAISPQDILADGTDFTEFKGVQVRKATVAAFLANIELMEDSQASIEDQNQALRALTKLAPSIIAIGLSRHAQFKNPLVESILQEAIQKA